MTTTTAEHLKLLEMQTRFAKHFGTTVADLFENTETFGKPIIEQIRANFEQNARAGIILAGIVYIDILSLAFDEKSNPSLTLEKAAQDILSMILNEILPLLALHSLEEEEKGKPK